MREKIKESENRTRKVLVRFATDDDIIYTQRLTSLWISKSACDVCVLYAALRSSRPLFAVAAEPTDDFDAIEKWMV